MIYDNVKCCNVLWHLSLPLLVSVISLSTHISQLNKNTLRISLSHFEVELKTAARETATRRQARVGVWNDILCDCCVVTLCDNTECNKIVTQLCEIFM